MMHINDNFRRMPVAWALPVLLIGGLLLAGCDSDPVAPQDGPPTLSVDDVANQAGWVAMAAAMVSPQTVEFSGKADKDLYTYTFFDVVSGVVNLDFTAGGLASGWATADHVDLFTGEDAPLVILVGVEDLEGTILLGLDLTADIDRVAVPNTAAVDGTGTFASGPYTATFTFDGLAVAVGSAYPGSGTMTFMSGGFTAVVTFDGDNTAFLDLGENRFYVIDLDTGEVSDIAPAF